MVVRPEQTSKEMCGGSPIRAHPRRRNTAAWVIFLGGRARGSSLSPEQGRESTSSSLIDLVEVSREW